MRFNLPSVLLMSAVSLSAALNLQFTFEDGVNAAAINTVTDTSGNALNGTSTGGVYSSNVPVGGGSLSGNYSGDLNYITVADNPLLRLQEFTVSLDFFADDPNSPGGATPSTLFAKKIQQSGTLIANYYINYDPTDDSLDASIAWGAGSGLVLSAFGLTEGQWRNVAITLDRDVSGAEDFFGLYVDGALVDSVTQEIPTLNYTGGDLVIGAGNFGSGPTDVFRRNFDGAIDNFEIHDTSIPEPGHFALLASALLIGLLAWRRRRR